MAKNTTKGMRGVAIDFAGRNRQLRYPHGMLGDFEKQANDALRAVGIIRDIPVETRSPDGKIEKRIEPAPYIYAHGLFSSWMGNSDVFSLALLYGLKHEDAALTIEQVNDGIDNFAGSITDLTRAAIEAFKLARDPSSVASLKRSWQNSDINQQNATEKALIESEIQTMQDQATLTRVRTILEKVKLDSGNKPPATESS